MSRYALGMDSSTQSLSAVLVDLDRRRVVYDGAVTYDRDLPRYGTHNGVLPDADPRVAHAPPLMWVEALDALFAAMKREGAPLGSVVAVSGSGQQHGSVYLNERFVPALDGLKPGAPLAVQLKEVFARPTSPIWMDSSTSEECREIESALGGRTATAEATGSTTFERFTGPQIRKFFKQEPEGYRRTRTIHLVSSFMATLLGGRPAPIDPGDGAGMNLMDIRSFRWLPAAMKATADGLEERLPRLAPSWTAIGPVHRYFAETYGLNPEARAVVWSGDNPNSMIGLGLIEEGKAAISLGTSDTFFGAMSACRTDPRGEGHVFGSPAGGYMSLICYKNGSLARERVRDAFGMDWDAFSKALSAAPPGNGGALMLPFFEPEIVPRVSVPGVRRRGIDESDAPANCRAVVEAQMMSMRLHSEWMGRGASELYATGGASANEAILQVMADVHQCPVTRFEVTNSAALGAALRADHAFRLDSGEPADWREVVSVLAEPVRSRSWTPAPGTGPVYDRMAAEYAAFEAETLAALKDARAPSRS